MDKIADPEELVSNPSKITNHLIEIVLSLNTRHEAILKTNNFIKKFKFDFKIAIYLKDNYHKYYLFLKEYQAPSCDLAGLKKFNSLFDEFERLYDKLIFNNFALMRACAAKKEISNKIFTMEDEKIFLLKKLFYNEVTVAQFIKRFGHCALNPYELSSKRFEEYGYQELLSIAKFTANFKIRQKIGLEETVLTY